MQIQPTDWFSLGHTPVREGWYEVKLASEDTAYAKFIDGEWTEKPVLLFTHWRGLRADPSNSDETPIIDVEATAAQGVRAAWDAFFPKGSVHQDD